MEKEIIDTLHRICGNVDRSNAILEKIEKLLAQGKPEKAHHCSPRNDGEWLGGNFESANLKQRIRLAELVVEKLRVNEVHRMGVLLTYEEVIALRWHLQRVSI